MAKQANRMMIGGFVVLAVIIMAASLVVFGSGKFFKKTNKYILYFDESVKGLSVGAPVLFQGVQVGSVTSIILQADFVKMKTQIPVIIEIEPDRCKVRTGERSYRKVAEKLIEMGLRAQLVMQSFITGQLMIELDFYPNSKVCYAPPEIDKDYKDVSRDSHLQVHQRTAGRGPGGAGSQGDRKGFVSRPWPVSTGSLTTRTWLPAFGP